MSAICRFCGQEFANAQAVRAHLKGCSAYQDRKAEALPRMAVPRENVQTSASLGNRNPGSHTSDGTGGVEAPFDPVRQLEQRLAAERIRLQLREVEEAHAELDRRSEAKERERQRSEEQKAAVVRTAERDREEARRQANEARLNQERRAQAEQQRHSRRREVVQNVKRPVVDQWYPGILARPDLKARVLQEIERELAALPVEDLPISELVLIAEGIRDRLYHADLQTEQRAQERKTRIQRLVQHGCAYASSELRDTEGLTLSMKWDIERRIREELGAVEGDETTDDIEDWVDEILEDAGIAWDAEDE